MAKIKWGMMVVDGRGKLGGHVLSKNRSGAYVRTKVTPVNPQTAFQTQVRSLFGTISQQWSGLTDVVRAGWNEAVAEWQKTDIFGDLKQPSGKSLFQRLNNQAQIAGYPAVTVAPAKLEMVEGIVSSVEIAIGAGTITLVGAYGNINARNVLLGTAQLSSGTTFVKNKLRKIYSEVGGLFSNNFAYDAYVGRFGVPSIGDNVYIAVKYVLPNGQASPAQILKATVVA